MSALMRLKKTASKALQAIGLKEAYSLENFVKNSPRIVEYEGNRFDVRHPRCNLQIAASIINGHYEEQEIGLIRNHIKPGDRVLELGSCMGVTSLIIYDMIGRDSHLVVEADSRNLAMSRQMFSLNQKDVRIEYGLLQAGENLPEFSEFSSNENASSSSIHNRSGADKIERVPVKSFEETLRHEGSTALVLDIEGGEYDLLGKCKDFGKLRLIMMETHPWVIGEEKMKELLEHLDKNGFSIAQSFEDGRFLVLSREIEG